MSTDDIDTELARILADCASEVDLEQRITRYAHILQRLVCCMVGDRNHAESRVRTLYADLAELAVEKLEEPRVFPRGKLH